MAQNNLNESDKNFIREYVASGSTERAQSLLRKECADSYQVSIKTIAAITAWTKIRAKKGSAVISNESETVDRVCEPQNTDASPTVDEKQEIKGGEYFEYDTPIKNAWRKKLGEFIDRTSNPNERRRMRVLCLPGIEGHEIPIYLERGFLPQNIVGVEGGNPQARAAFLKTAEKFNITPVTERLENMNFNPQQPFDVVSLDFLGQMCEATKIILGKIPLACTSRIMVNLMAKREDYAKEEYKRGGTFMLAMGDTMPCNPLEAPMITSRDIEASQLSDVRDEGLTFLILEYAKNESRIRGKNYRRIMFDMISIEGAGDSANVLPAVREFMDSVTEMMLQLGINPVTANGLMIKMNAMIASTFSGLTTPLYVDRYEYMNSKKSRYISDFVHLASFPNDANNWRSSIEFVLGFIKMYMECERKSQQGGNIKGVPYRLGYVDQQGQPTNPFLVANPKKNLGIGLFDEQNRLYSCITFDQILKDTNNFGYTISKFKFTKNAIRPREKIIIE